MSGSRRGMTLLEVVVAIALLAIIAVVVLTVMMAATAMTAPRRESIDPHVLRALVEKHFANDEALAAFRDAGELTLMLGDTGHPHDVRLRWLPQDDGSRLHDWIEAICDEERVLLYVRRPRDDAVGAEASVRAPSTSEPRK